MMKLFVWDNVLTDYTSGIMFAIAPDVEDARKQLIAEWSDLSTVAEDLATEPKVYRTDRRVCRAVWGGG
jgi:hypothetical protein